MKQIIALIGFGPRGLSILERLLAIAKSEKNRPEFIVHIISDGKFGCGVHVTDQPMSLLVNTVASQITMFADQSVKGAGPVTDGPCFYTWLTLFNYYYDEETRQYNQKGVGRKVQPNDYLPRAIFGEYLHWTAGSVIRELWQFADITIHMRQAVSINKLPDDKYEVSLDNGEVVVSDYLILATGHAENIPDDTEIRYALVAKKLAGINPHFAYTANPYPIAKLTSNISPDATIAIEGFGLTATDILSELTIGRGGRFMANASGGYDYEKSGKEPTIVLYSRNGIPFSGRAVNQKGASSQYKPSIFTLERIQQLKEQYGIGVTKQLDFERHVLPDIIEEMMFCYYSTLLRQEEPEKMDKFILSWMQCGHHPDQLNKLIELHFTGKKLFNWQEIMDPTLGRVFDFSSYRAWLLDYLYQDFNECLKGNVDGAFKSACDVLRDIRDIIRSVIDFAGLTESSHRVFIEKYVPVMNRISVGPPKERIAELIALVEAGVVDIFTGRNPSVSLDEESAKFVIKTGENMTDQRTLCVDQVITARIASTAIEKNNSPFIRSSLRAGLIRPFLNGRFHPGGIDLDRRYHPINASGQAETHLWALGTIAEGPKYYTYIVPRKGVNSTGLVDAGRIILDLFEAMYEKQRHAQRLSVFFKSSAEIALCAMGMLVACVALYAVIKGFVIKFIEADNADHMVSQEGWRGYQP